LDSAGTQRRGNFKVQNFKVQGNFNLQPSSLMSRPGEYPRPFSFRRCKVCFLNGRLAAAYVKEPAPAAADAARRRGGGHLTYITLFKQIKRQRKVLGATMVTFSFGFASALRAGRGDERDQNGPQGRKKGADGGRNSGGMLALARSSAAGEGARRGARGGRAPQRK
jgi:hypothetical protein